MRRLREPSPSLIDARLAEVRTLLPTGSEVLLSWIDCRWPFKSGWRVTCKLPDDWAAQLAVVVAEAHDRQPFTYGAQWVKWTTGLSLGGGPTLAGAFVQAVEQATIMRGLLACPTCGHDRALTSEVVA